MQPRQHGVLNSVPPAAKSTSVYVGKIASTLDDAALEALLRACGAVKSWNRVTDAETNKPKGFGFCEFEDADGVLRALRLLNGLKVCLTATCVFVCCTARCTNRRLFYSLNISQLDLFSFSSCGCNHKR